MKITIENLQTTRIKFESLVQTITKSTDEIDGDVTLVFNNTTVKVDKSVDIFSDLMVADDKDPLSEAIEQTIKERAINKTIDNK